MRGQWVIVTILLLLLPMVGKGQMLLPGTSSFMYSGYGPLRTKPVKVFYHIPKGNTKQMQVLLALHGDERDGKAYAEDWIAVADKHGFMVFAPEFSDSLFGGGDGYNLANMYVNGDQPSASTLRPDSVWTFSLLDPLFQFIKQSTGARAAGYVAFGHSAGAQLLHRFVAYKPNSQLLKAICANSGWYTLPDNAVAFPYGTKGSPFADSTAKKAFAKNLLVLLGQQDINPNSPGLRHMTQADAQGITRLARGRYFYKQSRMLAAGFSTPFNWSLAEVAGVGHNHSLMAANAVQNVLAAFTPPGGSTATPIEVSLTDKGIRLGGLNAEETFTIRVYSIEGKLLRSANGVFPIDHTVSLLPKPGTIYLIDVSTSAHGNLNKRIFSSP